MKKMTKSRYAKMKAKEQFAWRVANGVEAYVSLVYPALEGAQRDLFIETYRPCCVAN